MSSKSQSVLVLALVLLGIMCQVSASVLSSSQSSCCGDNSIVISGNGKVSVQPDIAIVSVGASVTARTSQAATQGLAQKITQVLKILTLNKIASKDIETQYISIYPQYEYPDGKQVLTGQTASQTLRITVRSIDSKGGNLGPLIDALVAINGIQFNNLSFDKENKSEAQKQARKLAFEDAKKKAFELANLADRTLGKALSIVDNNGNSNPPVVFNNAVAFAKSADTSVPVGALDVTYGVQVKFLLI